MDLLDGEVLISRNTGILYRVLTVITHTAA